MYVHLYYKKLSNIYLIYFANKIFEYRAVCPWEVINVLRWVLSFKIMKIISQFQDVSIQAWFFLGKVPKVSLCPVFICSVLEILFVSDDVQYLSSFFYIYCIYIYSIIFFIVSCLYLCCIFWVVCDSSVLYLLNLGTNTCYVY